MKVGVIIPIGEDDDLRQPVSYGAARTMALQAEAAGFDSIWLPDHLLFRFPDQPQFGVWERWTFLMGLAESTTRVEIGALVMCVPFRNLAQLAKMSVTADEVSSGRLILGLGAGWHEPEFNAFEISYEHLGSQFAEGK